MHLTERVARLDEQRRAKADEQRRAAQHAADGTRAAIEAAGAEQERLRTEQAALDAAAAHALWARERQMAEMAEIACGDSGRWRQMAETAHAARYSPPPSPAGRVPLAAASMATPPHAPPSAAASSISWADGASAPESVRSLLAIQEQLRGASSHALGASPPPPPAAPTGTPSPGSLGEPLLDAALREFEAMGPLRKVSAATMAVNTSGQ